MSNEPSGSVRDSSQIDLKARIKRLESATQWLQVAERRATEHLLAERQRRPAGEYIYVGIASIALDDALPTGSTSEIFDIQQVLDPPGEVHLARALNKPEVFGYLARYTRAMSHELVVPVLAGGTQAALNKALAITSLLRIRTRIDFICPAFAHTSWSTIPAFDGNTCEVQVLDDFPQARQIGKGRTIRARDIEWVATHLLSWFSLWESPSFRIAAESYRTFHQHPDYRMMTASIWSGIESLFDISAELRYRLAVSIASILEPRGDVRVALYNTITKAYDVRSKIVHGARIEDQAILRHVVEASELLSRILASVIERGNIWSKSDLEHVVLGK
jgi:hypothetical protein